MEELAVEERRNQTMMERLADGVITSADYMSMNAKIVGRIDELRELLKVVESRELSLEHLLEALHNELWNTSIRGKWPIYSRKQSFRRGYFPKASHGMEPALEHPQLIGCTSCYGMNP
jgi:hypothetical protein